MLVHFLALQRVFVLVEVLLDLGQVVVLALVRLDLATLEEFGSSWLRGL